VEVLVYRICLSHLHQILSGNQSSSALTFKRKVSTLCNSSTSSSAYGSAINPSGIVFSPIFISSSIKYALNLFFRKLFSFTKKEIISLQSIGEKGLLRGSSATSHFSPNLIENRVHAK